jgi:hypothetical protein
MQRCGARADTKRPNTPGCSWARTRKVGIPDGEGTGGPPDIAVDSGPGMVAALGPRERSSTDGPGDAVTTLRRLAEPVRMSQFMLGVWPVRLARCDALDVSLAPIPKVASTSLLTLFHGLDHADVAAPSTSRALHAKYGQHRSYRVADRRHGWTFVVVRDPVERLCSAYSDRVVNVGVLVDEPVDHEFAERVRLPLDPDLATFVDRLDDYRRVSNDIRHHTNGQSWLVRRRPDAFDRVYGFDELDRLRTDLSERAGAELVLPHRQTGGPRLTPADLDARRVEQIVERYRADYRQFPGHLSEASMRQRWGI